MATAEELLAQESCDNILTIDLNSRTIIIPTTVTNIGVESDDNVEVMHFRLPRYHCEVDLSTFAIRINYLNAKGGGDVYEVKDAVIGTDLITFDWVVGRNALVYKGTVTFIVCLKELTEDGEVLREFNTTIATLPVLPGLETGEAAIQEYTDILEQWRSDLFGTGNTVEQQIRDTGAEVMGDLIDSIHIYVTEHPDELKGDPGVTFTPSVDDEGNLSWTNDGDLDNPETKNVKGATGDAFTYDMFTQEQLDDLTGPAGKQGYTFTPSVDDEGNLSWTNDGDLDNPETKNITGKKGDPGDPFTYDMFTSEQLEALKGASIESINRTAGTGAAGTVDTYTVTLTDGRTTSFNVYNGADGLGAGDMLKSVYDPQSKNTDIFAYVDDLVGDIGAILDDINGE